MMYKLEVLSAAAQRKEHYFNSLEEALSERGRIREQLNLELIEALEEHQKEYDCENSSCNVAMRLKHEYEVRFKIYIARWEVIG